MSPSLRSTVAENFWVLHLRYPDAAKSRNALSDN